MQIEANHIIIIYKAKLVSNLPIQSLLYFFVYNTLMDAPSQYPSQGYPAQQTTFQVGLQPSPNPLNIMQNAERLWQIHSAISKSSSYTRADLLGLLYSSRMEDRRYISNEDQEGKIRQVLSHIPNNIVRCPHKEKNAEGIFIQCTEEEDMLPPVINMDKPPKGVCQKHELKMEWAYWNPPCSDIGFEQISGQVLNAANSNTIGLGYFPDDFEVTIFAVEYAEQLTRSIYSNEDGDGPGMEGWVHNKYVWTDEGFWFTLENAIIINIQVSIYKSQGKAIDKMMANWNVNQASPLDGMTGRQNQQAKGLWGSLKNWMSG